MSLELDPIYHTATMVKILREQGSTLHAMELCEKILEKDPDNQRVRKTLEEIKGEARASFERFRQAGRPPARPKQAKVEILQTLLQGIQEYRRVHG